MILYKPFTMTNRLTISESSSTLYCWNYNDVNIIYGQYNSISFIKMEIETISSKSLY